MTALDECLPKTGTSSSHARAEAARSSTKAACDHSAEALAERTVAAQVGALTLDDESLTVCAAANGLGIACAPEFFARSRLDDETLVPVLSDWCHPGPGLTLC